MKLNVVIVDDEPLARAGVRALLEPEPDVQVVGEFASGDEALPALRGGAADLVFLDVDMPGMDGFALLASLRGEAAPAVVFVTAHEEHALHAFDVAALDYLVKPFGRARFREALQRARDEIGRARGADPAERVRAAIEELRREYRQLPQLSGSKRSRLQRLTVRRGSRLLLARVADIDWLEAQGNYVRLHCGADDYLIRATLSSLEERLDPGQFLRIHRSTIVNLDRIRELRPWSSGDYKVILDDGTPLRLSRGYREKLEARLGAGIEVPP